jgi:Na+/H+-dicarboxylate symporter
MAFPMAMMFTFALLIACTISIATYKAIYNNVRVTVFSIAKDIFKYYKFLIMAVFSYYIIMSAFANLGTNSGILCCLVVACIYFGWIAIDLFRSVKETNITPVIGNYAQAIKECFSTEGCTSSGAKLTGGGNLFRQLKKLNKVSKSNKN